MFAAVRSLNAMTQALPPDYRRDFERKGHFGPVTLFSESEMADMRASMEELINGQKRAESSYSEVKVEGADGDPVETLYDAHLTDPVVRMMGTHPLLAQLAKEFFKGPAKLWRSTFWIKGPGARRLEWHQDTYKSEGFGSFPNLNAWIAVDPTNEDNAVQMASGTHRAIINLDVFKHPEYVAKMKASPELPPPIHAPHGVERMVLRAGQCFVFDGRVLHGSPPNHGESRRAGIVVRFIPTSLSLPGFTTPCVELG
jgi:non-haem Fe2+, alpha-ketoglutarate-dependent halogenase